MTTVETRQGSDSSVRDCGPASGRSFQSEDVGFVAFEERFFLFDFIAGFVDAGQKPSRVADRFDSPADLAGSSKTRTSVPPGLRAAAIFRKKRTGSSNALSTLIMKAVSSDPGGRRREWRRRGPRGLLSDRPVALERRCLEPDKRESSSLEKRSY